MRRIMWILALGVLTVALAPVGAYDYGTPGYPGYGMPMPPMPPMPYGPGAAFGQPGIEKGVSEEGYTLRAHIGKRRPQDIEVVVERGHLVLRSVQSESVQRRGDGSYHYQRSFSRFHRAVQLPEDADPDRLVRTDGEGYINVLIPRRQ